MKKRAELHPAYRITVGGLMLALGVLLPQAFHIFGQSVGQSLLPMHIPTLIAGMFLGWETGLIVGAASPVLSFLFTGMPVFPRVVFMIVELAFYGASAGIFYKKLKWNIYLSLLLAQICGRIGYALTLLVMGKVLGLPEIPELYAVITAVTAGWMGIILQWVAVPPLVVVLKKGGALHGRTKACNQSSSGS